MNNGIISLCKEFSPPTGFYMPPEWHHHKRSWMAWPCRLEIWKDKLNHARIAYKELALQIAQFEPVCIICQPNNYEEVQSHFKGKQNIDIIQMPIDDSWLRDNGPIFLINSSGEKVILSKDFNAWGEKYTSFERDRNVPALLAKQMDLSCYYVPLVLEGGAISVDGEGTLLTTESTLLNPNRNSSLIKEDVDQYLNKYLGINKIIWLKSGLKSDETDGHVDNVAAFICPGVVVTLISSDKNDENYEILKANRDLLSKAKDARGRRLRVYTIEQPDAAYWNKQRLTLSYINFYFVNGGFLLPKFGQEKDHYALRTFQNLLHDRTIVQFDSSDIVIGGGGIHCVTQQEPAAYSPLGYDNEQT